MQTTFLLRGLLLVLALGVFAQQPLQKADAQSATARRMNVLFICDRAPYYPGAEVVKKVDASPTR